MDLTEEYLGAKKKAGEIKTKIFMAYARIKRSLKIYVGQDVTTRVWKQYINQGLALIGGYAASSYFGWGWKSLVYIAAAYVTLDVMVVILDAALGGKIQRKLAEAEERHL